MEGFKCFSFQQDLHPLCSPHEAVLNSKCSLLCQAIPWTNTQLHACPIQPFWHPLLCCQIGSSLADLQIALQAIATALNRFSKGGASAERMYRTLTDPEYKKSTNKHGRRLNSRKGTPMHIMAAFALRMLPNHRGNLTKIAEHIEASSDS